MHLGVQLLPLQARLYTSMNIGIAPTVPPERAIRIDAGQPRISAPDAHVSSSF